MKEEFPDLRRVHGRTSLVLGGLFGLLALVCLILILWASRASSATVPRLEDGRGPLAEALKWPWQDFPGVALVERETIQREFKVDEPLLAADLRLWSEVPASGPFRPASPAAREEMESAVRAMRSLPAPTDPPLDAPGPGEETPFDPVIRLLSRANNAQPNQWLILYDRGVLQYRKGNYAAAERDLEAALRALRPLLDVPSAPVYEAAIHTYYAQGHALARGGDGEPEGDRTERRAKAIKSFRFAAVLVRRLWETGVEPYSYVPHPLTFFQIQPTNLSTGAIASDLVAAYMAAPGYHDCEEKPQGDPCDNRDRKARCYYRDSSFCLSQQRASGPFGPAFLKRHHAFYDGGEQALSEEHRLWALSNAVDRWAENSTLGEDPYLLYNLSSLLIQVGEFEPAAVLLDPAIDSLTGSEPPEDYDRITRLAAVSKVLAGSTPRGSTGSAERDDPSDLRQLFRILYKDAEGLEPREFGQGGRELQSGGAQALLDRWLFLHLWRQLLQEGRYERFVTEYERLMAQEGVFKEFFRRWHDEVLADFGRRALAQAETYEKSGEGDRAKLIRRFLSDNGHFPPEIESQARGIVGWIGWGWRTARAWIVAAVLLLLLIVGGVLVSGLMKGHRQTFFSTHRLARRGDEAYPK